MFRTLFIAMFLMVYPVISHATDIHHPSLSAVDASGYDEKNGHKPEHMVDGSTKTRWAVNGGADWALFTLTKPIDLSNVVIIPFKATERRLKFDLLASLDNKNWITIGKGIVTSNQNKDGEKFTFPPVNAKFIKLNVYGTDINKWSAIIAVEFNSAQALPETPLR